MKRIPLEDAVTGLTPALLLAYIEAQPETKTWNIHDASACPIKDYLTHVTGLKMLNVSYRRVYKGMRSTIGLPNWALWFLARIAIWGEYPTFLTRNQVAAVIKEFLDV